MAERLTEAHAARLDIPGLRASSAGTRAVLSHPIHPDAAAVLEQSGADASGFAARQINPKIAGDSDLVLTMTREHRSRVLELSPRQLHRTFTLSEAALLVTNLDARTVADLSALRSHLPAHQVTDIPDPIGQSAETFATVGAQIAELLTPVLKLCRSD
jgi:protein-tyrosine phosphatase